MEGSYHAWEPLLQYHLLLQLNWLCLQHIVDWEIFTVKKFLRLSTKAKIFFSTTLNNIRESLDSWKLFNAKYFYAEYFQHENFPIYNPSSQIRCVVRDGYMIIPLFIHHNVYSCHQYSTHTGNPPWSSGEWRPVQLFILIPRQGYYQRSHAQCVSLPCNTGQQIMNCVVVSEASGSEPSLVILLLYMLSQSLFYIGLGQLID